MPACSSQVAASVVLPEPGGPDTQIAGAAASSSSAKSLLRGSTPTGLGRVVFPSEARVRFT